MYFNLTQVLICDNIIIAEIQRIVKGISVKKYFHRKKEVAMIKNTREEKKTDLRVIKTKKILSSSLMDLLEEKSIDSITVQEICRRAMINRMTFYKHYSDKYALLYDCVKTLEKDVNASVEQSCSIEKDPLSYCEKLLNAVVNVCEEKKNLLKKLTLQNNVIASGIISNCIQEGIERMLSKLKERTTCPIEYEAAFITGGCTKVVLHWISYKEETPKEQLLKDISPLVSDFIQCCLK